MADKQLSPADEAMRYGELAHENRQMTEKNNVLKKAIVENTAKKEKLDEDLKKGEASVAAMMKKAKDAQKALDDAEARKEKDFSDQEGRIAKAQKELAEREKAIKDREEALTASESAVSKREEAVETAKKELKDQETALKMTKDDADESVRVAKEEGEALATEKKANENLKKEAEKILKDAEKIQTATKKEKASVEAESVKLRKLIEDMGTETSSNKKIRDEIAASIPRLQSLLTQLREYKDFVSAHMGNPDAIDAEFERILPSLEKAAKEAPSEDVPA